MDIQLFMSIFKGRHDVYAKRWEKDGKNGYSPAYKVDWSKFSAFKVRGGKFADYPHKQALPLTLEIIQSHLEGNETIGIYPLLKSKIALRDYQSMAVDEAMNKDYGVIVAPSGSGKTVYF